MPPQKIIHIFPQLTFHSVTKVGQTSFKKANILYNLLKKPVHALIISALLHSPLKGWKLFLTCPSPYCALLLAHIYRCPCRFLKLALGIFRDLKENLRKIFEGNINPLKCQEKMCHPTSNFSAVVCDGTVVTKIWMQHHTCIRSSEGTALFSGKECKFPTAGNSCGTKKSILCIWNSIISIHSFL